MNLDALRHRLADQLAPAAGPWTDAFRAVARDQFVPLVIYRHDRDHPGIGDLVPLHRATDPQAWAELVYSDQAITTQVDDGHPAPDGTGWQSTSSTSQPSVMADMLQALTAERGQEVLEIGTGTGWNAGLLAHRLGWQNVITVEVDAAIAEQARAGLSRAELGAVQVEVGDGGAQLLGDASVDRVLATVSAATIPPAWVAQCRPGGRVVAPLAGTLRHPGIVVLDVHPGGTATGRLAGEARFMALRGQRVPRPRHEAVDLDGADLSVTDVHPHWVVGDRGAALAVELRVPGIYQSWAAGDDDSGDGVSWLSDPVTGSWSAVHVTASEDRWKVRQAGPRRLWDEAEAAHRWWDQQDRPTAADWLWTVTPAGQTVNLAPELAKA